MIEPNKLSPFRHFCMTIGAIPSSYKESLTYYEMLEWLCKYLQDTVIPAVNNNAEALEELQTAFVTLKDYVDHYFDDLDIQEEINNKLDEMAEQGELTDIIAQYLQLAGILAYDSVADLKAAENLVNGSLVKTYGYYAYNDNGGAFYKVRNIINTDVPDDVTIIALHDVNLVAELIFDKLNVKQFGAKGDGTTDDTAAIQKAISYLRTYPRADKDYSELYFPNGTYLITDTLDFNNSRWLKIYGKATITGDIAKPLISLDSAMYLEFKDLLIINDNTTTNSSAIYIENSYIINFNNIYAKGGDIVLNIYNGNDLNFIESTILGGRIGLYTASRGNNTCNNFIATDFESATEYEIYVDFVSNAYGDYNFTNCYIESHTSKALVHVLNGMYVNFNQCYFNQLTASSYIYEVDGTISPMRIRNIGCDFSGNSAYLIKHLANNIRLSASFDNTCRFQTGITRYNTADTYPAAIGSLNPELLNIYNLTWFKATNNVLDEWLGTGTYTLTNAMTPDSLKSCAISSGYIYKEFYLEKDVLYEFKATVKNTGSGNCRFQLFNQALDTVYFQVDSGLTTPNVITGYYKPTASGFYRLLIRNNSTTTAEFSGVKVLAHIV